MASCKWACYGGSNGWGKCMKIDDCHHKAQMRKAPKYLHEIVDYYYFGLLGFAPIDNPLREKFSHVVHG